MALLDPAGAVAGQLSSAGTAPKGVRGFRLGFAPGQICCKWQLNLLSPKSLLPGSGGLVEGTCLARAPAGRVQPLKVFCHHLGSGTESDQVVGVSGTGSPCATAGGSARWAGQRGAGTLRVWILPRSLPRGRSSRGCRGHGHGGSVQHRAFLSDPGSFLRGRGSPPLPNCDVALRGTAGLAAEETAPLPKGWFPER